MMPAMLKPAFSTVTCPEWLLREVADRALGLGFEAVELRTFGDDSRRFACDPALSGESKTRATFLEKGVEILSLGTSVRFDEPVWPPVVGHFSDHVERSVREGKAAVDLAVGLECPLVRVFGFEFPTREKRASAIARIAERLVKVVDHADKSGVRVVVENGGSFLTAAELRELIARVNHPLLGAGYCNLTAMLAGEDPVEGVRALGDLLWLARIKDSKNGVPCELGTGSGRCEAFVRELVAQRFQGPLVYEWDRAWDTSLASAETVLPVASRTIFGWLRSAVTGAGASAPTAPAAGSSSAAAGRGR